MGLYKTEDTRNEAFLSVKQLHENPADKVVTLIRKAGIFNVYNNSEFLPQLRKWKELGVKLLKCNIYEKDFEGKTAWLFIITLPGEDNNGFCPLSLSLGVMCSGIGYIAKEKATADLVWTYLGSHE